MAHELTMRAGNKAEMAYAGETPWHGLGQKLEAGASMAEWQIAAGMDWEILPHEILYNAGSEIRAFPGKNVLSRSDNHEPLSVVSERYKIVQPAEVLEFFTDLVQDQGFTMHTAGTLFGGKKFWALAKMEEERFVARNKDGIGGFALLVTSCDGSLATTSKFVSVATVCNNTLRIGLSEKGDSVRVTHGANFDAKSVKKQMGLAKEEYDQLMDAAERLSQKEMSLEGADEFLKFLLTETRLKTDKMVIEYSKPYQQIMNLYQGAGMGSDLSTREGTAWGLLNAVTEYVDHHSGGRTADARINSAWFGKGDSVKTAAAKHLLELC